MTDFLGEAIERKARQLPAALAGTTNGSPADAAKAIELAPSVGVPPIAIRQTLPTVEADNKRATNAAIAAANPALAAYLINDPVHAEASSNDFANLGFFEKLSQTPSIGFESGLAGRERGAERVESFFTGDRERLLTARERSKRADEKFSQLGGGWWLGGTLASVAGQIWGEAPEAAALGVAGAVLSPEPTSKVIGTAVTTALAIASGVTAFGTAWDNMDQAEEKKRAETGRDMPIPLGMKIGAATADALVTTLADKATFGIAGAAFKSTAKTVSKEIIDESLARAMKTLPAGATIAVGAPAAYGLRQGATAIGSAIALGAAAETVQSGVSALAHDMALAGTDPSYKTVFNDQARREEVIEDLKWSFVAGGALGGGLALPGVGVNAALDRSRANISKQSLETHDQVIEAREASETYKATPEGFAAFTKQALGERQIEIDADLIVESGTVEEFLRVMPGLDKKFAEAVERNGTLSVSYADYTARVPKELDAQIKEGIRFDPEGVSSREAEVIKAWHASPHAFERFSLDFMGTGEGNQAFGRGAYFAESREIVSSYERDFAGDSTFFIKDAANQETPIEGGELLIDLQEGRTDLDEIIQHLEWRIESVKELDRDDLEYAKARIKAIETDPTVMTFPHELDGLKGVVNEIENKKGDSSAERRLAQAKELKEKGATITEKEARSNLYRVAIKAAPEELLDYDKPLSEQPEAVKPLLKKLVDRAFEIAENEGEAKNLVRLLDEDKVTGGVLVHNIEQAVGAEASTKLFREAGIPGLRYLDAGSRKTSPQEELAQLIERRDGFLADLNDPEKLRLMTEDDIVGEVKAILERTEIEIKEQERLIAEGKDDRTRNIVVFDDSRIEILDRNGVPVERPLTRESTAQPAKPLSREQDRQQFFASAEPGVPEVAPGMVRMYNSGSAPGATIEPGGKRWFSTDPIYGRDYRGADTWYIDVPEDHPAIQGAWPDQGVKQGFTFNAELPAEGARLFSREERRKELAGGAPIALPPPAQAAQRSLDVARKTADELWIHPLFTEPKSVGMDAGRFGRYSKRLEEQIARKNETALRASTLEAERRLTKEWKAELKAERLVAEEALNERPDVRAYEYLVKGKWLGTTPLAAEAKAKLNAADVAALAPDAALPRGITVAKGGFHPDEIAPLFEYRSGRELLLALNVLEASKEGRPYAEWRKSAVESLAINGVEGRLGELDARIEREGRENALRQTQQDILSDEAEILGAKAGLPFDATTIRVDVGQKFAQTRMGEARNYIKYARDAGRAGRNAEMHWLKKTPDAVEAFKAKQAQFFSHVWAAESAAFNKEVAGFERKARKLGRKASHEGIEQGFTDQIHRLLARNGRKVRRDGDELQRALGDVSLEGFVHKLKSEGEDAVVHPSLYGDAMLDPANMTVEQQRHLANAITSLEHIGRERQQITLMGEKVALKEVIGRVVERLRLPGRSRRHPEGERKLANQAREVAYSTDSFLMWTKTIFREMDDWQKSGPAQELHRKLMEAKGREGDGQAEVLKMVKDDVNKFYTKDMKAAVQQDIFKNHGQEYTEARNGHPDRYKPPLAMTKMSWIGVAANMGTSLNEQRLIYGEWPDTKRDVKKYIAKRQELREAVKEILNENDWKYVEGIWGIYKKLLPQADAAARELNGIGLKIEKAAPIDTKFGRVEGGYIPIIFHEDSPITGEANALHKFGANGIGGLSGWMQDRVDDPSPRRVVFENLGPRLESRLKHLVTDIHMKKPVTDAWKVLGDAEVAHEIDNALGPEYRRRIKPYLQDISGVPAASEREMSATREFLSFGGFRTRLSVAATGFNINVAITPGVGHILRNVAASGRNPRQYYNHFVRNEKDFQFVEAKSSVIRNWEQAMFQEYNDFMGKQNWYDRHLKNAVYYSYWVPRNVDRRMAKFNWHVVYTEAKRRGMNEEDAVYEAERDTRDSFSLTGSPIDTSPLYRASGESWAVARMFASWADFQYNKGREVYQRAKRGDVKEALAAFISFIVTPAAMGFGVTEWGFEDDDELAEQSAKVALGVAAGTFVGARDIHRMWATGMTSASNPMLRMAVEGVKGAKDIAALTGLTEEEISDMPIKNIATLGAFITGAPAIGPGKVTQFLTDYANGDQDAETLGDWYRGFAKGRSEKP